MDKIFLARYTPYIYAIFRIVIGFLFTFHGAQKLFGWFGRGPVELASLAGVAGVIELGAGLLVMIGLFTGWAAFLASGTMAVAYWMAHAPEGTWPIQNGGELAVVYAFVFLFIAARGAGPWSVAAATAGQERA